MDEVPTNYELEKMIAGIETEMIFIRQEIRKLYEEVCRLFKDVDRLHMDYLKANNKLNF